MPSNSQTKSTTGPSRVERRQMPQLFLPAATNNIQCGPSPHSSCSLSTFNNFLDNACQEAHREGARRREAPAVPPLCSRSTLAVPMRRPWERTPVLINSGDTRRDGPRATCEDKLTFLYILTCLFLASNYRTKYSSV
mgnify:CR=1 FL=1